MPTIDPPIYRGVPVPGWNYATGKVEVDATLKQSNVTLDTALKNVEGTPNQAAPTKGAVTGGVYLATAPALTDGQMARTQMDAKGNTLVGLRSSGGTEPAITTYGASDGLGTTAGAVGVGAYSLGFNGATWDRMRVANVFKYAQALALAGSAAGTLWTPAAGKKPRVMGGLLTVNAAGTHQLRIGPAGSGTVFLTVVTTAAATIPFDLKQGKLATNANDVVEVYNNNGTNVDYRCTVFGTEE